MAKQQKKQIDLEIRAQLKDVTQQDEVPSIEAYLFASGGRLLARSAVNQKGEAKLRLPESDEPRSIRAVIGPALEREEISLPELIRRGAEERRFRIDPGVVNPRIDIDVIPERWRCWFGSRCNVRGVLLKRVEIDGVAVELPVCHATVDIYEVDPFQVVIPRLPESILEKIRDILINPPRPQRPIPPPPPPPIDGIALPFTPESPATDDLPEVSEEVRSFARIANPHQIRHYLVDHLEIVRPILCRYFPWLVSKYRIAQATTDDCGRFQASFFRSCSSTDQPDLYFTATQKWLGFINVTVYEPKPVPCFTYWNYQCGTEVRLYTSHPLAQTCSPCPPVDAPPDWVMVTAIGNLPLSRIRGCSSALQTTTDSGNRGLVIQLGDDASVFDGRPFGGFLRLRCEFDNSLRESLGVKYYRVSYRKGTSGAFTPLTGEVHRHYSFEEGTDLVFKPYTLGPTVVNGTPHLYEIPPALPPQGQWSYPDLHEDLTSAKFPTADLAPPTEHGKYQLKIDLFDTGGNLVDVNTLGISYRVPVNQDLSGPVVIETEDAAGLGLVVDEDGDGKKSFLMTVHVDNNHCTAEVQKPQLAGPANDCGVMEYDPDSMSDNVTMPYTAVHPNGFATYRFRLKRGIENLPSLTQTGQAVPPGSFSQSASVGELLGECPIAAFSEDLDVWAMATNGWGRLSGYDAGDHAAFVLAPEEPEDES